MVRMRDGSEVTDPRLGHIQEFDERSRDYNIQDTLDVHKAVGLRDRRWSAHYLRLNQGQTSACTGFSRTYDLYADPCSIRVLNGIPFDDNFVAQRLYALAKQFDAWPGTDYEGSSVLGALKACKHLGLIGEYRWAFNIDDALDALAHLGGLVIGSNWYESMFHTRPSGLLEVRPTSGVAGGHAYYIPALHVTDASKRRFLGKNETLRDEPLVEVLNSWGAGWGKGGFAGIWASDLETLLNDEGGCSINTTAFHTA